MKSLFEQMGGTYREENGYLIPNLTLPDEEQVEIGVWGERHLRYIKQHNKVRYIDLLTSGKLNSYLADVDCQAQERYELLVEQMKQSQGITEQLKAKNAMEWTRCMNNIQSCALEIINKEIIFC